MFTLTLNNNFKTHCSPDEQSQALVSPLYYTNTLSMILIIFVPENSAVEASVVILILMLLAVVLVTQILNYLDFQSFDIERT
jgi:hypothetical protein